MITPKNPVSRRNFLTATAAFGAAGLAAPALAQSFDPYTGQPLQGTAGGATPDAGVVRSGPGFAAQYLQLPDAGLAALFQQPQERGDSGRSDLAGAALLVRGSVGLQAVPDLGSGQRRPDPHRPYRDHQEGQGPDLGPPPPR